MQKHRRRYTRHRRAAGGGSADPVEGPRARRSWIAASWRALGKPVYNFLAHGPDGRVPSEEWRPESGPWPLWIPALGTLREVRDEEGARAEKTPPETGYGSDSPAR